MDWHWTYLHNDTWVWLNLINTNMLQLIIIKQLILQQASKLFNIVLIVFFIGNIPVGMPRYNQVQIDSDSFCLECNGAQWFLWPRWYLIYKVRVLSKATEMRYKTVSAFKHIHVSSNCTVKCIIKFNSVLVHRSFQRDPL